MKKVVSILIACWGLTAAADCPPGKAVSEMTCRRAQSFAARHQCYWKYDFGQKLDIFPVLPADQVTNCDRKNDRVAAFIEVTLDDDNCVLGYFCQQQ